MTTNYALTDDEARTRYDEFRDCDPFPDIPPALLNSADIIEYVVAAGMLFPFRDSRNGVPKLKPASCEVDLLGTFFFWDEKGSQHRGTLNEGEPFVLAQNSIAFVEVEPTMRLPHYIAARFNLSIHHVHRGLLLGTGPLIDPGFAGKILIPLHNLTSSDYTLHGGDSLIAIEFTKINWPAPSMVQVCVPHERSGLGTFCPFPKDKLYRESEEYLKRASPWEPIRNSIPGAIATAKAAATEARSAAENAVTESKKQTKRITIGVTISVLAVGIGLISLTATTLNLMLNATTFVQKKSEDLGNRIKAIEDMLDTHGVSAKPPPNAAEDGDPPAQHSIPASEPLKDAHQEPTENGDAKSENNSAESQPETPE